MSKFLVIAIFLKFQTEAFIVDFSVLLVNPTLYLHLLNVPTAIPQI